MDDLAQKLEGVNINERNDCGQTPLHQAIISNDLGTIRRLLEKGADANSKTWANARGAETQCHCRNEKFCFHVADEYGNEMKDGSTVEQNALHLAAKHASVEVVKLLLGSIRDIEEGAGDKSTALHFATQNCTRPDSEIRISELLLDSGASVDARNEEGKTPLYLAVKFERSGLARYLVSRGASVNVVTKNLSTPLYSALINYNWELVTFLLDHNAVTALTNKHDEDPLLFVLRVSSKGEARLRFVKLLLETRINVDHRNCHGSTALHVAVYEKDEELAKLLIENGCPIDSKDFYDCSPLSIAVCTNLESMARILLERGANINDFVKSSSILELAVIRRKERMIHLLLEHGADVNIGSERNKPVAAACLHKNTRIMQMLIDKGADINYKDKNGRTPLMRVIKEPNYEMMRHLLEQGANVNDRDNNGNTALHILFENSTHTKENIIEYLLEHGADVNLENNNGFTPFRYMMFKCFTKGEVFIFIKHIALLISQNFFVNPKNIVQIGRDNTWTDFSNKCLLELTRLKEAKIHNKFSYFDVIVKKHTALVSLLQNQNVASKIESEIAVNKFYNYSDILIQNFHKKKNRLCFIKQATIVLHEIFESELPPEILEKICEYLSDEDLKRYLQHENI